MPLSDCEGSHPHNFSVLYNAGFFESIMPVNFNTIATPHAGVPRYPSFLSSVSAALGPRLLSRTGEQFFCVDKWSPSGRPLLIVMADPGELQYLIISLNSINSSWPSRSNILSIT